MSLAFVCTGCGKCYDLDDSVLGRRVRCKSCGAVARVTGQGTASREPAVALSVDEFYGLSEGPASAPTALKRAPLPQREDEPAPPLPSVKNKRSMRGSRSSRLQRAAKGSGVDRACLEICAGHAAGQGGNALASLLPWGKLDARR